MSECTERSEGREGIPRGSGMSECTERSEGREGIPQRDGMRSMDTPVGIRRTRVNSVKRLGRTSRRRP
jgi:hypothetical protein